MKLLQFLAVLLCLSLSYTSTFVHAVSIETLAQADRFTGVKISPDGKKFAVRIYQDKKYSLIFFDAATFKVLGAAKMRGDSHVGDYAWANNERVVISLDTKVTGLDELLSYGELFAVNFDGSKGELIFSANIKNNSTGTRLKKKKGEIAWANIIDTLPEDNKHILIRSMPMSNDLARIAQPKLLNIYNGKVRKKYAKAPINNANFITNKQGELTVAIGIDKNENTLVFLYDKEESEWNKVDGEKIGDRFYPLTVSNDGKFLLTLDDYNQDKLGLFKYALDGSSYKSIYTDPDVDITDISISSDGRTAYAIRVDPDYPNYLLFDKKHPEAQVFKNLLASFPGYKVRVTSQTDDGNKSIIYASSDQDPGTYYLYDVKQARLQALFKSNEKIKPSELAKTTPIKFLASDDLAINGYLIEPNGKVGKPSPMVVMVHGGPHGIRDYWLYDYEAQVLAAEGYSVLKLNFRGSAGYGNQFVVSGYKQWGARIQQDIIEGTRWAIDKGYTTPDKVCVMGSSFGAYSAVQSAIMAPGLFKCSIANAGIYDLNLLYKDGDIKDKFFGKHYLTKAIGTNEKQLAAHSPVHQVDKLKVPLLLAHGKKDGRAPYSHALALQEALDKHNKPYELYVKDTASHGFHDEENRVEYLKLMVSFLNKHL